ncbi:probable peptidoglycan muropeptide transporter SLC46 [Lepeophtheirus salmonis]|uniref:probable peptidoglycan muropeptide transporter SLC46 n=1 Tax=Lepeophtheirus salmonis TaxID=72036 RepID=UPI001AE44683|nr:proton-coupled folate transporter-like [Lepeophtheirus salmonis]XP_040576913.1 proton-coupled folate transporter-like [Lepeophtheirus salmonis]XP_040576914.1 proton-coupled folate transporter-like [Lepeophtheirus salmonis]XP_040576915.1 proton-coupled folate transporter-like [Lepeophtheirus salmonis]XP_040576916.1 proton-coupled folate transporter-like [Lepeophtheirus salmonis]XP_040576917.1 proton-coupled folate transporter-like [Lepeophtheirus salmonis]XP_040576918.1 proton-coupled folat
MQNYITVEPVQLFYGIMAMVSSVVRDHLFIEKVCQVHLNYSSNICSNLSQNKEIKDEVQEIVTELEIIDGTLVAIPAVVFSLFMGSWSDRNGRKFLLILPFIGNIIAFLVYILNYYFFFELGIYNLLWGSSVGMFGGYVCLNIGLYGYIADVSTITSRTTRLSYLNGITSLSFVIGSAIGGQLFNAMHNYYIIFGISIGFGILGIIYSIFFVKESIIPKEESEETNRGLFDLYHVKECFKTATKDRSTFYPRFGVIILVLHFASMMFCLNTSHYDYLLMVNKFDWGVHDFSNFLIVTRIVRFVGLLLLLPLLSSVFHIRDEAITLFGTILTCLSYLIIALGQSSILMFVAVVFQFNSIVTVSIRSQCTKATSPEEVGKVFAVIALGQSLVPLVSNPLFGLVYRETLTTFPGAYLIIVCAFLLVACVGAAYLYNFKRRNSHVNMS